MEASQAKNDVKDVVRRLLSHDAVDFNSTINAYFASSCTYRGHGLRVQGASNLKHAAFLFNLADIGSAAKIDDSDVHWDETSSTAHVKATRHLRPRVFPLFQFAVPTEVTLKFNPSSTDSDPKSEKNQLLYCTSFEDKWPLDSLIRSIPVVAFFYAHLYTPLATVLVLQLSNLVFALNARMGSWDRRVVEPAYKSYSNNVEPQLPKGLKDGFEQGKSMAEGYGSQAIDVALSLARGPLKGIEFVAQTSTSVANAFLPRALQLPYPSVFNDDDASSSSSKRSVVLYSDSSSGGRDSGSQMPEIRLSPSDEQPPSYRSIESEQTKSKDKAAKKNDAKASGQDVPSKKAEKAASAKVEEEKKDEAPTSGGEEKHAKVVIGSSDQEGGAREIDVVTHEETRTGGGGGANEPTATGEEHEGGTPSLYSQLKKEGNLEESLLAAESATAAGDGSSETSAHSSPKLDQSADEATAATDAAATAATKNGGGSGGSKKKKKSKSAKGKK